MKNCTDSAQSGQLVGLELVFMEQLPHASFVGLYLRGLEAHVPLFIFSCPHGPYLDERAKEINHTRLFLIARLTGILSKFDRYTCAPQVRADHATPELHTGKILTRSSTTCIQSAGPQIRSIGARNLYPAFPASCLHLRVQARERAIRARPLLRGRCYFKRGQRVLVLHSVGSYLS